MRIDKQESRPKADKTGVETDKHGETETDRSTEIMAETSRQTDKR